MQDSKTFVFIPKMAFGPVLNCIGIAQQLRSRGHKAIFICDPLYRGTFADYGFSEYPLTLTTGANWSRAAFIAGQQSALHLDPLAQLPALVCAVWEVLVERAMAADADLRRLLALICPDLICLDNSVLLPAVTQAGCPWVRVVSSCENEIADPAIPPFLSGCSEHDEHCFELFRVAFQAGVAPVQARYNAFLQAAGLAPYPLGQFCENSPTMNLLLYPEPLRYRRAEPLPPARFQYLEGCMRSEETFDVPVFACHDEAALIYVKLGAFGCADTALVQGLLTAFGALPYRFLVALDGQVSDYTAPGNVHLAAWYPQPSVIPLVDLFIHHGGNNSFNEALYFGKPSLVMPFCWDGHDTAARIVDTGYGIRLSPYGWQTNDLAGAIDNLLTDTALHGRLQRLSQHMQRADGRLKAARIIEELVV